MAELLKTSARLQPVLRPYGSVQRAGKPTVVVDYAHTPDALEKSAGGGAPALRRKLWCVFGCGGDRDKGKRPLMGLLPSICRYSGCDR